jgi:hypothetical protein
VRPLPEALRMKKLLITILFASIGFAIAIDMSVGWRGLLAGLVLGPIVGWGAWAFSGVDFSRGESEDMY